MTQAFHNDSANQTRKGPCGYKRHQSQEPHCQHLIEDGMRPRDNLEVIYPTWKMCSPALHFQVCYGTHPLSMDSYRCTLTDEQREKIIAKFF